MKKEAVDEISFRCRCRRDGRTNTGLSDTWNVQRMFASSIHTLGGGIKTLYRPKDSYDDESNPMLSKTSRCWTLAVRATAMKFAIKERSAEEFDGRGHDGRTIKFVGSMPF